MKDIYNMKLHDKIEFDKYLDILRVPGGWLYTQYIDEESGYLSSVFVPWHDSGRQIENGDNYRETTVRLAKQLRAAESALQKIDTIKYTNDHELIRSILEQYTVIKTEINE